MFDSHTPIEAHKTILRYLSGETLYMGAREAARNGQIDILRMLNDEGRFSAGMKNVASAPRTENFELSGAALPMVDAIACMINRFGYKVVPYPAITRPGNVNVSQRTVLASEELRRLIHEIFSSVVKSFGRTLNGAQSHPTIPENIDLIDHIAHYEKMRKATAAVMACIACALDDPELLTYALSVDDKAWSYDVCAKNILPGLVEPRCTPAAFAINFGSVKVLKKLPPECLLNLGSARAPSSDQRVNLSLNNFLGRDGDRPIPEMFGAIIAMSCDQIGFEAIKHDLTRIIAGRVALRLASCSHLFDVAFDGMPSILVENKEELINTACRQSVVKLLDRLVQTNGDQVLIDLMKKPKTPAEDARAGVACLHDSHPLFRICDGSLDSAETDEALLFVLKVMDRNALLSHAMDPLVSQLVAGGTCLLSHVFARDGYKKSLIFLADHGLDLETKDTNGRSLLDHASENPDQACTSLVVSLLSRKRALEAIQEFSSGKPKALEMSS